MARSSQSQIEEKLASLQANFKQTLPDKIDKIEQLWNAVISSEANESAVIDCHRMSHTVVGSGGTFGAVVVSSAARELEQALKLIVNKQSNLTSGYKLLVSSLISKLKDIAENWQPSKTPHLQPFTVYETSKGRGNLIYLAEDDAVLAHELVTQLGKTGFVIKHFADLDIFSGAVERELPSAVIMDIMFKEGDIAGVDKILKLKQELEVCPPIVFISARNDIEARLAAAKAGAQRYFTKPLDLNNLSSHVGDNLFKPS